MVRARARNLKSLDLELNLDLSSEANGIASNLKFVV